MNGPELVGALVEGDAPPVGDGLVVEVRNALPIERDARGAVTSKVFIACSLDVPSAAYRGADDELASRRSFRLPGPILAGEARRFHLSTATLAWLRAGGGDQGWLRVRDSLNIAGRGATCDVPVRLPAADATGLNSLTVTVEGRLNDNFACSVEPISAAGPGRA